MTMSMRWTLFTAVLYAAAVVQAQEAGGTYPSSFDQLDGDGDGYISQEEAAENPHLVENWLELDRDESGRLDPSEFAVFEEVYQEDGGAPLSEDTATPDTPRE